MIVAGTNGPARWAPVLSETFSETLPTDGPIVLQPTAGWDGVTGANKFESQTGGDNAGTLLVPGAAILASLTGSSRVHFDYQRWLPVFLSVGAPVVVGRVDFHRSLRMLLGDHPVRVAVSTPDGLELPTLLAMTILSMRVIPVSGIASPEDAIDALRRGEVDVVQLPASAARPAMLQGLAQNGFEVLFTLGQTDGGGSADFVTRVAALQGHASRHPLYQACLSASVAAGMDAALVLPMLTSPAQTARWRHAAQLAVLRPEVTALAKTDGTRAVGGADVATLYHTLTPDLSGLLALRRWLAERTPGWRSG
ncbi:hypothetical protein AA21952_0951 [Acetobacter oeni LMG 21952]|nr:hypothetical protein AA21952_0951 [Acetobacter oeni LMG 21952]